MTTYLLHMKNGDVLACDDYIRLRDYWVLNRGQGMDHVEVLTPNEAAKRCLTPSLSGEPGNSPSAPTPTLKQGLTTTV